MVVTIFGLLLISSFFTNCQGNGILIQSSVNMSGVIHCCLSPPPESSGYEFRLEKDSSLLLWTKIEKLLHGDDAKNVACSDTNQLWLDGGPIHCNMSANSSQICNGYYDPDCASVCKSSCNSCEVNERNLSLKFTNPISKTVVVMWRYTVTFKYEKCSSVPSTMQTSSDASQVATTTTKPKPTITTAVTTTPFTSKSHSAAVSRSPTTQMTRRRSFSVRRASSNHGTILTISEDRSSEEVTAKNNGNTKLNQISTDQGIEKTTESPSLAVITYITPIAAAIAIIIAVIATVICIRKERKSASNETPLDDAGTNSSEVDVYACVNKENDGTKTTVHYTKEMVDNELYGTAP